MCLHPEWFERSDERLKERDERGVSVQEAEATLLMYHSTIYPVAVEVTEWILRNWSKGEIGRLSQPTRDLFYRIVQENGLRLPPSDR
jgi:hypothetical protein